MKLHNVTDSWSAFCHVVILLFQFIVLNYFKMNIRLLLFSVTINYTTKVLGQYNLIKYILCE